MRGTIRAVGVLLAALGALAGCGEARAIDSPAVGSTAVVTAHSREELAPVLGAAERDRLRTLALASDDAPVLVHVVAAGRDAVETVDLLPRREDGEMERTGRRVRLVEDRLAALNAAIDRAASESTDVDLLRAIDAGRRTGATEIVLLNAGLPVTPPFDVRGGWDADPVATARGLGAAEVLPDLSNIAFTLSGFGRTAPPQPVLGIRELRRLTALWAAVCREMKAEACTVDDSARAAPPSMARIDQPIVALPETVVHEQPGGTSIVEVPVSLLFAADSCRLEDGAASALSDLAAELSSGAATVAVSGRTAPVGAGDGVDLATCRAGAAAGLLRQLGVPSSAITAVTGDGTHLDPPDASLGPDGRPDPVRLAALRRVVFTVTEEEQR